ncbi:hypothetical protein CEUSTIGMA_g12313.t1, partial [Chlamydomonas eustigma]
MRSRKLNLHQINAICVKNLHIWSDEPYSDSNPRFNNLLSLKLFCDHGSWIHDDRSPVRWELLYESEEVCEDICIQWDPLPDTFIMQQKNFSLCDISHANDGSSKQGLDTASSAVSFSGYHVNTPALIETTKNDDVTSSSAFGVHISSRLKREGVPVAAAAAAAAAGSAEGGASYSSTGSRGGTNSYLQAAARQTLTESQQLSRWLLDEGSVFQPLNSNDALEEEAERALFSTSGTAHRALLQASADIGMTWTGDWRGASSSISGGNNTASNRSRQLTMMVGGGIAAELAQLQRALGVLFGTQVLPTTPNIQTSIESNNVNILNTSSLPLGSSTVSQGAQGHSKIGRS